MPQDRLALDRASVRTIDQDGHLHVAQSNISRAAVNGYLGREIPEYERLGLQPDRLYQLLRDPVELEKGAASFEGKPLLIVHKPQTAADHDRELTVGSVNNVKWKPPFLTAGLAVWDGAAIAGIDSGEQKELSSAYRYDADMTPGIWDGERYDGVMRNIVGNHVALVESGRAGSDVVVGDAALQPQEMMNMAKTAAFSRQALFASGALRAYLVPKLAKGAKIDLAPALRNVSAKTWDADSKRIRLALDAALPKGSKLLAADADLADVDELLSELKGAISEVAEPEEEKTAEDEEAETEEEKKARLAKRAADKAAKDAAPPDKDPKDKPAMDSAVSKAAMDAAILASVTKAQAETRAATIADMRAMQEAERAVRPFVGDIVIACDSASEVYKIALDLNGVKTEGVHASAYPAMVAMLPRPGEPTHKPRLAQDGADAEARFRAQYPTAARLIRS